ncbi:hypothetical protein G3480_06525 [Thiorhodococcus mannitoliphagus]|uniref:Uncharacterized protein n=1 Tax=Thiorhodococcus mannitoliphagus TaxID=329406 RepID=A0A6P1DR05_9GAMM|nr:hypothetical protein [Thiorhodococcus mannitoliphagus]NEX19970.1 hypothetical protein [Thiorhodococcus mannitoliphagus]
MSCGDSYWWRTLALLRYVAVLGVAARSAVKGLVLRVGGNRSGRMAVALGATADLTSRSHARCSG